MDMEKIYLTMKRTGAGNIVLGILSICIGLASGIMLIITGKIWKEQTLKVPYA